MRSETSGTIRLLFLGILIGTSPTLCSLPPSSQSPPNQVVLSPCTLTKRLSSDLWKELKIDDYIKSYPQGQTISVQEFARQNGAPNFHCAVGEKCNVGELCHPVQGLAWYALFAIQELNLFMNSMYNAVGTTMDLIRFTTASLLMDIVQPQEKSSKHHAWFDTFLFLSAVTVSLSSCLYISMGALTVESAWLTVAEISGYVGVASNIGIAGLSINSLIKNPSEKKEQSAFSIWSEFAFYFSKYQASMQESIIAAWRKTLDAGIASPDPHSIANLLSNGSFIEPRAKKSFPELEAILKNPTQIRALVILLRSMNAFVTRGGEPCQGRGPNGARDQQHHFSYCGGDHVMMNIVIAREEKVVDEIYNANSIESKYSISTEYLTVTSWKCQTKHGMYYDPYEGSPLPTDPNAECLANLPVCDLTIEEISNERRRSNLVKACREIGKLKI